MDNSGFELDEEAPPSNFSKPEKIKQEYHVKKSHWSLLHVFLVCLLACAITTVVGVLILSLVYVSTPGFKRQEHENQGSTPQKIPITSAYKNQVDLKFQFLHHHTKSKMHQFPGGAIQWSRFRRNGDEYQNMEEMAFGTSINAQRSKIMFGTLLIKSEGLRAPHWHFNANEQGYLLKGTAWIGVVDAGGDTISTYNVTAGQIIFFPRNTLHWIKNVGVEECLFLLFFTTHEELQTMDLDDTFFLTPKDIEARSLKPEGGMDFIRSFQKQAEDQAVNLPPNLAELVQNTNYNQSADMLVWRYFFDLKGSFKFQFPGGVIQWARYIKDGNGLKPNEKIYSEFLHSKEDALTLATLRIFSNALRQPHFHFNANEMGYVISGCGKVGVIVSSTVSTDFTIEVGDVVFFPVGTQHYIKSTCDEDLLLILAFSTSNQLETLDMDDYFHATADHILAQLFFKKQAEFKKIPRLKEDQAINLP
ncbi:dynactin-associated protein [Pituophis catenifer annectens]|uniref:dynactin-associated protein n=1 Tax=Pituophis catenifer annectens TaxID=94852 RepID=UPI003992F2B6